MTPPAFGRLGRLLLQDGRWGGRQLIGSDYIAAARKGTAANPCYGFLWRNNDGVGCGQTGPLLGVETAVNWMPTVPTDAYALAGMFDQLVLVIPSLDMVVVRMGLPHQMLPDPWGDVSGEKPGFFDFVGVAKYEAWAKLKGTAEETAQKQYVDLVKKLAG